MAHCKCGASLTKRKFLDSCKNGYGPVSCLSAEIPYTSPERLYPLFSGSGSFVFESVKGPEKIARYSFIGFDPYLSMRAKEKKIAVRSGTSQSISYAHPLKLLGELLEGYAQKPVDGLPPFQGGAAGLLSYDFSRYLERLPDTTIDDLQIPDAHFFFIDRLISFDHKTRKAWAIVCPGVRRKACVDAGLWYEEAESVLDEICRRIESTAWEDASHTIHPVRRGIEIIHGMKKKEYMDMVIRAKEYIAAGDIFQANLSHRISAHLGEASPWELYRILSAMNPSPFAGFADFGEYWIVSSSPERLVKVKDGTVETRPIAGTRPRGKDMREDELMRAELLLNEKERAEHIMLIDLERNDLGRVSMYGSVEVDELMITEDYSHVMHIVSNVRGKLMHRKTCLDVIRAVFPGGTITGVPKVRCMEIIDELEPVRRGPYTGSLGYLGFSGVMDMNIIIRSFVVKNGHAYVQAGAGIVADSDPEREYHETIKKAEALIASLGRC
ncbi:MAG TPA: anthranilate synthase component I family protein [Thermodesulfovibrionales bacterium]|nr:anthranilate synthase component I family protein [Thermodesulfovibrionales bacterium]